MAERALTILSLSDFHFGGDPSASWRAALSAMTEDLGRLGLDTLDLVLVSGDVVTQGTAREFDEASRRLDELRKVLSAQRRTPAVLVVPGNHDANRSFVGRDPAYMLARHWTKVTGVRENFWSDPSDALRIAVDRTFAEYQKWWEREAARLPGWVDLERGLLPGDFAATVRDHELVLGVAGMNSAFLHFAADTRPGTLDLDPKQLEPAVGGDVDSWAKRHHCAVLLSHHPPTWLRPEARKWASQRSRFSLHLCGHCHDEPFITTPDDATSVVQTKAFLGTPMRESRDGWSVRARGYVLLRVDEGGQARVWPRAFRARSAKQTSLVADQEYALTTDDSLTFPIKMRAVAVVPGGPSTTAQMRRDPVSAGEVANPEKSPSVVVLKNVIYTVLPTDAALDEFCFAHFPDVYRELWPGMNRAARIKHLLERKSPGEILMELRRDDPVGVERGMKLLTNDS